MGKKKFVVYGTTRLTVGMRVEASSMEEAIDLANENFGGLYTFYTTDKSVWLVDDVEYEFIEEPKAPVEFDYAVDISNDDEVQEFFSVRPNVIYMAKKKSEETSVPFGPDQEERAISFARDNDFDEVVVLYNGDSEATIWKNVSIILKESI